MTGSLVLGVLQRPPLVDISRAISLVLLLAVLLAVLLSTPHTLRPAQQHHSATADAARSGWPAACAGRLTAEKREARRGETRRVKCKLSLQIALSAHVAGLVLAPRLPSAPRRMPRLVTWTGFPTLLAVWCSGAGPVTDGKRPIFKIQIREILNFQNVCFFGQKNPDNIPQTLFFGRKKSITINRGSRRTWQAQNFGEKNGLLLGGTLR